MKKTKIPFHDIEFIYGGGSDAGEFGLQWKCPHCSEKVTWMEALWWKLECNCHSWDFNLEATGEPLNEL